MRYETVIKFWFQDIDRQLWWKKDSAFDRRIKEDFLDTYQAAVAGGLVAWRQHPLGRLAEVIVLDQFSRNIYRDKPTAFDADPLALSLAQEATREGANRSLGPDQKAFLYMPFMHSESIEIHEKAVELFSEPGLESYLKFEYKHKAIIDRFNRYPHRNEILGRPSTAEEAAFLKEPVSSF
jgi:uncharacterized protein (DUF924 family)